MERPVIPIARQPLRDLSSGVSETCVDCSTSLNEIEKECCSHGITISYLPSQQRLRSTAGTILQRCLSKVEHFRTKMNKSLCVYKLGITADPCIRFFYYKEGNYTHMSLLHVSENLGTIQMLEAALISSHMFQKGCRNERLGGEGPPAQVEPFYFVYIVGARADGRKSIKG